MNNTEQFITWLDSSMIFIITEPYIGFLKSMIISIVSIFILCVLHDKLKME